MDTRRPTNDDTDWPVAIAAERSISIALEAQASKCEGGCEPGKEQCVAGQG